MKEEKCLCTFECDGAKVNIKEVKNFTTKEVFEKRFNAYCENKECDRICPLETYVDCLMNFLFDNYDVIPKEVIK